MARFTYLLYFSLSTLSWPYPDLYTMCDFKTQKSKSCDIKKKLMTELSSEV